MFDVIICLVLFVVGVNLKNWVKGFDNYDKKILNWLFLWHLVVGIGFVLYINASGGGDAFGYWDLPKQLGWDAVTNILQTDSASALIFAINFIPAHILNLSFFTGSMIYIFIGYAGFIFIYKIIKENVTGYRLLSRVKILYFPIFPYLLFLPNLNFWTSGIGKDTIVFFCIAIFVFAIKNIKKRFGYIVLAIALTIFIRPHILLFLFMAIGISMVFENKIKLYKKVLLLVIFVSVFLAFLPYVMSFAKIQNLDSSTIETYANKKAGALANKEGVGSGVDISNYPYVFKVFTFLFRPLFIDMPTPFGIAASFENLLLLLFFIKVFRRKAFAAFSKCSLSIKTLIIFSLIGSLVFPLILGNLGIILREKTPFTMAFIIFGYAATINYYSTKAVKQRKHFQTSLI